MESLQFLSILTILQVRGYHLEMLKNMPYCTCPSSKKSYLPVQSFFRCISEVFKLVLGRIISVVCKFPLSQDWNLFKRKRMFCCWRFIAGTTKSWKYCKIKLFCWTTIKKKKNKRQEKDKVLITGLNCHLESLGINDYRHIVVACCKNFFW